MGDRRHQLNNSMQTNCFCEKRRSQQRGSCTPGEPVAKKNHITDSRNIPGICSPQPSPQHGAARPRENSQPRLPEEGKRRVERGSNALRFQGAAREAGLCLPGTECWQVHLDFQTFVHGNFLSQMSYASRRTPLSSLRTKATLLG